MFWIRSLWWAITLLTFSNSWALGQYNREVVIFVYHRFGDNRYPSTNVPLDDFRAHLAYLKSEGFKMMSLSEAAEYLGEPGEFERAAVITVDDGFESFYNNGLPLLRQYGYPATLFVNTETVGSNSYMDWAQLKDCQRYGVEIGNHSHSHAYFLNDNPPERYEIFKKDIELAQQLFYENLGIVPAAFAYPYGEFDKKMKDIVSEMEFAVGAAQNSGVAHSQSDMLKLPRFPMSTAYSAPEKFSSKAQMRALKVLSESPDDFVMPQGQSKPELKVSFSATTVQTSQLQCFIQGSECELTKSESDGVVSVVVKPQTALKNRRTLYTLTVKGSDGNWQWFSHLWIDPLEK